MKPFQSKAPGNVVPNDLNPCDLNLCDLNTRESPKDIENGDGNPRTDAR